MWYALLLSLISGVLLTAGFPKAGLFYVSWVALIPLFFALRGRSRKQSVVLGFACGVAHFCTALYWIGYVVGYYGGLSLPLAILALLFVGCYLGLYIVVFALASHEWEARPGLWAWGLPAVWVALEWARGYAVTGFPWAHLGYTQTPFTLLVQVADVTGVAGVSWLVVFGNTCVMSWLNRRRPWASTAFFAVALLGAVLYGNARLHAIEHLEEKAAPVTVGVIQANIEQKLKWDPGFLEETLDRYRRLSLEAASGDPKPDLLIWPEAAAPFIYGYSEKPTRLLQEIIKEIHVPILFGSPAVQWTDEGKPTFLNMAYLVDGDGVLLGKYAKRHLVPFGEYVPFKKFLFFVKHLVEAAGDFTPGQDPSPLPFDGRRVGVLICYEDIFPELARDTVALGATMLANITNDAWYGTSSAPYQHVDMARWRAVEFRRPVVRAANTGISAIVDASGREQGALALNHEGFLVRAVRPIGIETFYARWGDGFAWICVIITFILAAYWAYRLRSKNEHEGDGI